jgi:hypothetical protein
VTEEGTIIVAGVVRSDSGTGSPTLLYRVGDAEPVVLRSVSIGPQPTLARYTTFVVALSADGKLLEAYSAHAHPAIESDFTAQPTDASEPSLPRATLSHEPGASFLAGISKDADQTNVRGVMITELSPTGSPVDSDSVVVNEAGKSIQPHGVASDGTHWAASASVLGAASPCGPGEVTAPVSGLLAVWQDGGIGCSAHRMVTSGDADSSMLDVLPRTEGGWLVLAQSNAEFDISGGANQTCSFNPGVQLAVVAPLERCQSARLGDAVPDRSSYASMVHAGNGVSYVTATIEQPDGSAGLFLGRYQLGGLTKLIVGQDGQEGGRAVAARSGKAYVAGVSHGSFIQKLITLGEADTDDDAFVVRFDPAAFARDVDVIETGIALIGPGAQRAYAVGVGDNGDVILGGEYDTPTAELVQAPDGDVWAFVVRRALP